ARRRDRSRTPARRLHACCDARARYGSSTHIPVGFYRGHIPCCFARRASSSRDEGDHGCEQGEGRMNVVRSSTSRVGRRWPMHALCAAAAVLSASTARGESAAYVVNVASNDVSVIDTTSNTVVATIAVGPQPNGVAVTPNGERVYVSNFQADTVSVIDAATRAVVGTIGVGEEPVGIAISPDGTRVYVANRGANTVSVIDSATDQLVATVDSGVGPGSNGIALSPDGTRAYVNNAFSR